MVVRALRPITTPQRLGFSHEYITTFETRRVELSRYLVHQELGTGNEDVSAGPENALDCLAKCAEEVTEFVFMVLGEDGKPREGLSLASVEFGRNAPDATDTVAHLLYLCGLEFDHAVGRVRDDGVNRVFVVLLLQHSKCVPLMKPISHCGGTFGHGCLCSVLPI